MLLFMFSNLFFLFFIYLFLFKSHNKVDLSFLVIEGISSRKNEAEASATKSVSEKIKSDLQVPNITEKDVDECHKIGPVLMASKTSRQNFIKHSTITKALREKRKLSKLISWKKQDKTAIEPPHLNL